MTCELTRWTWSAISLFFCFVTAATPVVAAEHEPTGSLYAARLQFRDEHGKPLTLDQYRGHPVVFSMIYSSCKTACPMTMGRLRTLEKNLETAPRVQFVALTFDPARDSPERLYEFKRSSGLSADRWHLLTGDEHDIRAFSILAGYSYQKNPSTDEILHSNRILLLDGEGRIVETAEGLNATLDGLAKRARELQ